MSLQNENKENNKTNSISIPLIGLTDVMSETGTTQAALAQQLNVVVSYVNAILNTRRSCSLKLTSQIAELLCCSIDDLTNQPTQARLCEIRIAHLERQLSLAKAELAGLKEAA